MAEKRETFIGLTPWPERSDLLLAAADIYFSPGDANKNIVIFGHTHKAEMWKNYELPPRGRYNIQGHLTSKLISSGITYSGVFPSRISRTRKS